QTRENGIAALAVSFALFQIVALHVEIEPREFVLVDDLLIRGFQRDRFLDDVRQFFSSLAAERDNDITAAFANGVNLVAIKTLAHGDASVPGGFLEIFRILSPAILPRNDEGQRVIFQPARIIAVGQFKIISLAMIHVRRENTRWPFGPADIGKYCGADEERDE